MTKLYVAYALISHDNYDIHVKGTWYSISEVSKFIKAQILLKN